MPERIPINPRVHGILTALFILSAFVAAAGCLGHDLCRANPTFADEPSKTTYDLCGTHVEWRADNDDLLITQVGNNVKEWGQIEVLTHPPAGQPEDGSISLRAAFNAPAGPTSTPVDFHGTPFDQIAHGSPKVGDYVSFCRKTPAANTGIVLSLAANARDQAGSAIFPAKIHGC